MGRTFTELTRIIFKGPVRTAHETHSVSVIKTDQLMLYREIIAVFFKSIKAHECSVCGQSVELLNVKPGGTHSDHWASKN
jgi:hypothetical protein